MGILTGGDSNGLRMTGLVAGTKQQTSHVGGRVRGFNEILTLAAQAKSKTVGMGYMPLGAVPLFMVHTTDTSFATATFEIGDAGDANRYRAAAAFTATDVPTPFGLPAAALVGMGEEQTAAREILMTNSATAVFPASGTYRLMVLYMAGD